MKRIDHVGALGRRLAKVAESLEALTLIGMVFEVVGGVILALQSAAGTFDASGNYTAGTGHPYAWQGVGVVLAALVIGATTWAFFRALRLFAEYAIATTAHLFTDA
jgi:hypothetical protein